MFALFTGDSDKHYALMDLSKRSSDRQDILSSDTIQPGHYCFSFWYQKSGIKSNLNVTLKPQQQSQLLWKITDTRKGMWIQVTLDINSNTPFQVMYIIV